MPSGPDLLSSGFLKSRLLPCVSKWGFTVWGLFLPRLSIPKAKESLDKGFIGLTWFSCPSMIRLLCTGEAGLSHTYPSLVEMGASPLELHGLGMGGRLFLQGKSGCNGSG